MKTKFTLKGLEIGDIKIGDIVVESEFFVKEAWGMKNLIKGTVEDLLHNMPKYLDQVSTINNKYEELSRKEFLKKIDHIRTRINGAKTIEELDSICKCYYEICPFSMHSEIDALHNKRYHELRRYSDDEIKELKKEIESSSTITGITRLINIVKSEVIPDKYRDELLAMVDRKRSEILFKYTTTMN